MPTCLEVDSILKSFDGRIILSDIYLCCYPGNIIALFGRNGTGKSTLLQIIFGTLKADRSFIRINEKVINKAAYLSKQIVYLPQHNFIPHYLTVKQAVELYVCKDQYKQFFEDPYLFKFRNTHASELSGGELRYLEIKLLLYSKAIYILLDEPFSSLSPIAAEEIRKHITDCAQRKGIILTDHNFREVHKIANQVYLLDNGYLKKIEDKEELLTYGYYEKPI